MREEHFFSNGVCFYAVNAHVVKLILKKNQLTVCVFEKVRQVEELWDELFHVIRSIHQVLIGSPNAMKLPVSNIKSGKAWI